MFKKLRMKFFLFVSLTTFCILFLVWLILNVTMHESVYSSKKNNLIQIQENLKSKEDVPPQFPGKGGIQPRYILINIEEGGNLTFHTKEDFPFDRSRMLDYAEQIIEKDEQFGSIEFYFYLYKDSQILFIDGITDLQSLEKTMLISTIICSVSFVSIAFFAFLISSLVVKPYERLYQKEKTFITNASHELKTPLAIIQTNNEVLNENYPNNKWITSNLIQTKRMNKLILELITLSKLEESQGEIPMDEFSLSELAYDAIVPYESIFEKKNLKLKKDIQEDIRMYGNEEYVMKMFQIFIDNALKYTKENGMVNVEVKEEKKTIQILFSNTTDLDSNKNLKNIFDRFYSLEPSKCKKNSGFGIGLSIAKTIIDMHKGKIEVNVKDDIIYFSIIF